MERDTRQPDAPELAVEELARGLSALLARVRALNTLARADERDDGQDTLDLPVLRQGLREVEQMASDLLSIAQASSGELLLDELPGLPLTEALSQLVESSAETLGLGSRIVFTGRERALPDQFARLLYRIAQEALARVPTHEGARRLRLSLDYRRGELVMSIEDDGVPGSAEQLFEQTPGEALAVPPFLESVQTAQSELLANALLRRLRGMVERLGGALNLTSNLEQGTQVQVRLPYTVSTPSREAQPATEQGAEAGQKISVLLVDSQAVSRAGLRRLLESYADLEIVGEAAESTRAVSETAELLPQVVLIDAGLPGEQSLETLRQVRQLSAEIHVLLLADREQEEFFYEAMRAGASGYLLKDIAPDELAGAVRQVARGEVLVQPQLAARLLTRLDAREHPQQESLTAREREVLHLLARGLRNKEIAERLVVSERTVNFHLANIYAKLHVSGRTGAISKALEQGLLTRP